MPIAAAGRRSYPAASGGARHMARIQRAVHCLRAGGYMSKGLRFAACLLINCFSLAALAAAAPPPKLGTKVEIKFGDSWLPATVTRAEGGRVRAVLESGMESWFGAGEFRAAGATTPPPPTTTP